MTVALLRLSNARADPASLRGHELAGAAAAPANFHERVAQSPAIRPVRSGAPSVRVRTLVVLCLVGGGLAFGAVSAAPSAVIEHLGSRAVRLATFLAPDLRKRDEADAPAARPFPTFVAAGRLRPEALAVSVTPRPLRSAHVPPIKRRTPHDPDIAVWWPGAGTTAPAAGDGAVATVADAAVPKARPARASSPRPPFDTSTRSALGGPRPAAPAAAKPTPSSRARAPAPGPAVPRAP
jgi:hypothetical protein